MDDIQTEGAAEIPATEASFTPPPAAKPVRKPLRANPRLNGGRVAQRARQRAESVREAAPASSAEDSGRKMRRRNTRNREDAFRVDDTIIPQGQDYNWKREFCFGEPDHDHMINCREDGWTPVPTSRHPNMMPDGTSPSAPIRKKGQVLMERPMYLTREAQQEDYENARQQVTGRESQIRQTPDGTLPRKNAVLNTTRNGLSISD